MRVLFGVFMMIGLVSWAQTGHAEPVMSATQQQCSTNADCTLVSLTCGNGCASVPINTASKAALEPDLRQQCGGQLPEESDVICHMNPPLQPACMNNRCTIGYAFENNASSGDYQTSHAPIKATATTQVSP